MSRDRDYIHRTVTLALVVLLHFLLLLMLLRLAPPLLPELPDQFSPISVKLIPDTSTSAESSRAAEERSAPESAATRAEERLSAPVPPPATPRMPSSQSIWSQVIPMSREEFAQADIARMPSRAPADDGEDAGESGAANGRGTDSSSGPGKGPNGETLYNARWYRRPTQAELSFYLPPGRQRTGWGMIACQTVADYRVENCVEIAESPGSGLAGAVRQAAWQFRVLPPRIGGRPMIGAWVRIRIDYTVSGRD